MGIDYEVKKVPMTEETELLIFEIPEDDMFTAKAEAIKYDLYQTFGEDPGVQILLVPEGVSVSTMDREQLHKMGLFTRQDLVDIASGELCALSLGVASDDVPLFRISKALESNDFEALEEIKEELLQKAIQGRCPICGTEAV